MRRLLHKDPQTGVSEYYVSDGERFHIEREVDVTDTIEFNKAKYNSTDERANWGEMAHIATIPLTLYYDLKAKGITDDPKKFKAWLNGSENRFFRARPGRV